MRIVGLQQIPCLNAVQFILEIQKSTSLTVGLCQATIIIVNFGHLEGASAIGVVRIIVIGHVQVLYVDLVVQGRSVILFVLQPRFLRIFDDTQITSANATVIDHL